MLASLDRFMARNGGESVFPKRKFFWLGRWHPAKLADYSVSVSECEILPGINPPQT
jgi:hypothetical protein